MLFRSNEAEQQRNALAAQQQEQQLRNIQIQNALREQRMAGEEEAAYRSAGQDMGRLQTELMQRGLGKQAIAVGAQMQKQQADKIAMLKNTADLLKNSANAVFANPTLDNALTQVTNFGKQTGSDISSEIAALQKIGNDPDAIKQWAAGHAVSADKMLPKIEQLNLGGGVQITPVSPLTGAPMGQATSYGKTMTPYETKHLAVQQGQLAVAQKRLEQETAAPVAVIDPTTGKQVYVSREEALRGRMTPAAGQEGLAPKEIQKREANLPQATSSLKSFDANADSFVKDLESLRDHPGLTSITGLVYGRTPSVTASGRAAQALYDKVVAKGGFQMLQDMRNASKTGGALGNVSDREGAQLKSAFAAIDRTQDPQDVRRALTDAIEQIKASKDRMHEAYDSTYEYRQNKPGTTPKGGTSIRDQADAILGGR